ncbi:hypothetical protein PFISCL1PPCAC_27643, partial [Pristionchus fissidentatus]
APTEQNVSEETSQKILTDIRSLEICLGGGTDKKIGASREMVDVDFAPKIVEVNGDVALNIADKEDNQISKYLARGVLPQEIIMPIFGMYAQQFLPKWQEKGMGLFKRPTVIKKAIKRKSTVETNIQKKMLRKQIDQEMRRI